MIPMTTEIQIPPELPECKKPALRLVIWPDESLKYSTPAFNTEQIPTRLVKDTAGAMVRALYHHHGVGLAAPQVGVPGAIFVMDAQYHQSGKRRPKIFINPQIMMLGDEAIEVAHPGEGCLSFPYDYRSPVPRANEVLLRWLDTRGEEHEEWFEGFESIIIQHEFDHLIGKCFYDRISRLKRDIAFRKARKTRRHYRTGYKRMFKQMKNVTRTKEYALKVAKEYEEKNRGQRNSDDITRAS
jgi:peptide deformylase